MAMGQLGLREHLVLISVTADHSGGCWEQECSHDAAGVGFLLKGLDLDLDPAGSPVESLTSMFM